MISTIMLSASHHLPCVRHPNQGGQYTQCGKGWELSIWRLVWIILFLMSFGLTGPISYQFPHLHSVSGTAATVVVQKPHLNNYRTKKKCWFFAYSLLLNAEAHQSGLMSKSVYFTILAVTAFLITVFRKVNAVIQKFQQTIIFCSRFHWKVWSA